MESLTVSGSSVGSTSSSLIRRVRQREPEAWRQFIRLYGPLVNYWLGRTGLRESDAEDVFQDVFTTVARGIAEFRKDRPADTFRGWLRTIVRSRAVDFFRRAARNPQAAGGSAAHEQLQRVEDPDVPDCDEPDEAEHLVLAPVLITSLLVAGGTLVAIYDSPEQEVWPSRLMGLAMSVGGGLALYVFMEDALHTMPPGIDRLMGLRPARFNWPLFLVALGCLSAPVVELGWRARPSARIHKVCRVPTDGRFRGCSRVRIT